MRRIIPYLTICSLTVFLAISSCFKGGSLCDCNDKAQRPLLTLLFFFMATAMTGQLPGKPVSQYGPHETLDAIIWVETRTGANAYNRNEPDAVGILQLFPVYVHDVNRIIGYKRYKLKDRLDPDKSKEMFWIYQTHYNPGLNIEKMIRIHSGGPDGWQQDCTVVYLKLVSARLYEKSLHNL